MFAIQPDAQLTRPAATSGQRADQRMASACQLSGGACVIRESDANHRDATRRLPFARRGRQLQLASGEMKLGTFIKAYKIHYKRGEFAEIYHYDLR